MSLFKRLDKVTGTIQASVVTGLEGDENDRRRWRIKGVRGRAETGSLRKQL
jgi:hypothetical protein